MGVTALTVAVRGVPRSSAISPKYSPAPRTETRRISPWPPCAETSTLPRAIT